MKVGIRSLKAKALIWSVCSWELCHQNQWHQLDKVIWDAGEGSWGCVERTPKRRIYFARAGPGTWPYGKSGITAATVFRPCGERKWGWVGVHTDGRKQADGCSKKTVSGQHSGMSA